MLRLTARFHVALHELLEILELDIFFSLNI